MTETGLHIPCRGRVLSVNANGLSVMNDFNSYMEACTWWNTYMTDLTGIRVFAYREDECAVRLSVEDCTTTYRVTIESTGEFLAVVDKITGVLDSNTCKEELKGFADKWNRVCSGDLSVEVKDGTLYESTSEPATVIGSIFREGEEVCW